MCNRCKDSVGPQAWQENPIFTQLSVEYQKMGLRLPWVVTFKPSGTIGYLEEYSVGVHPTYHSIHDGSN